VVQHGRPRLEYSPQCLFRRLYFRSCPCCRFRFRMGLKHHRLSMKLCPHLQLLRINAFCNRQTCTHQRGLLPISMQIQLCYLLRRSLGNHRRRVLALGHTRRRRHVHLQARWLVACRFALGHTPRHRLHVRLQARRPVACRMELLLLLRSICLSSHYTAAASQTAVLTRSASKKCNRRWTQRGTNCCMLMPIRASRIGSVC
jgi:hypothetical protein